MKGVKVKPLLININEVCKRTSLSRTSINNYREQNNFPPAVKLGDSRIAFVSSEVDAWIQARINERDVAAA